MANKRHITRAQATGLMQLVDEIIHGKTGHTGGRNIWGGGSDLR